MQRKGKESNKRIFDGKDKPFIRKICRMLQAQSTMKLSFRVIIAQKAVPNIMFVLSVQCSVKHVFQYLALLRYSLNSVIHYENTPMQYTKKNCCKNEKFHWINLDIFLIFAQNIDCGYSLEPPRRGGSNEYPQSMFWSKNRYTPAYPSFFYIKVGLKGVYISRTCFPDDQAHIHHTNVQIS